MSREQVEITITFDEAEIGRYTDEHLAALWHVAQINPAPHGDRVAGEIVEKIGREIIRRWLAGTTPSLWHHQGRDYHWMQLTRFAKYEPGSPEWHDGAWRLKDEPSGGDA